MQELAVRSDREIAVGLGLQGEQWLASFYKGEKETVYPPEGFDLTGHCHPRALYGDVPYNAPTGTDCMLLNDVNRSEIVYDAHGTWVVTPNRALLDWWQTEKPDKAHQQDVLAAIQNNASIDGTHLAQGQITLEQYKHNMAICVDGESKGFDVEYYPGVQAIPVKASRVCRWTEYAPSAAQSARATLRPLPDPTQAVSAILAAQPRWAVLQVFSKYSQRVDV